MFKVRVYKGLSFFKCLSLSLIRHSQKFNKINTEYCRYCNGFKYVKCLECHGSGRIFYDGMKEHLCNNCKGRGEIICNFCSGLGCNNTMF
jgi:DnaJ-class molecular chaperone